MHCLQSLIKRKIIISCTFALMLGTCASMCCRFPGSRACYEHVMEVADADILADAAVWTSTHKAAWNNEFNCSNGDTFRWAQVWPAPLLQDTPKPRMPFLPFAHTVIAYRVCPSSTLLGRPFALIETP